MNYELLLEENINAVREKMSSYPGTRLLAATKTVPAQIINYAIDHLGINLIGENRVQELLEKYDELHTDQAEVHFIGSLQTNKVKYIVDKVSMIHSLDSEKLAREIDRQCSKIGKIMDVLIEINIADEDSKGGIRVQELDAFYRAVSSYEHVHVRGLMTMAPAGVGEAGYRRYFSEVKEIFDRFVSEKLPAETSPVLSMGMSDSYETALACGSNLIRVGSAIFGKRNY